MTEAPGDRAERATPFGSRASALTSWRARLGAPRDIAALSVFRMLFGALLAGSALRFIYYGWVERFFGERTFFFKYWGFGFVEPLSARGMLWVYATIALCGCLVMVGLFYRVAIVALFLLFSYAELTDVTNYLNHYYLVSLIAFLLCFMPLSAAFALDARLGIVKRRELLPAWMTWILRFQVCVVYFYAAKAKWGGDWLLRGQPLQSWLLAQVDWPLLGPWLVAPGAAIALSWAGMLHDLLVPWLLLWGKTRRFAYGALLVFHGATGQWFYIGIFPVLMPMLGMLFFEAGWPRRGWGGWGARRGTGTRTRTATGTSTSTSAGGTGRVGAWAMGMMIFYCLVQVLLPLRSHLYGGNVLWHEQGMRYAWKVLVRAKHGSVRYRVGLPDGREITVSPRVYLTLEQEREMAGQPDLILQLAHHIADAFRARGYAPVAVRADALVALNGRAPARMIDPSVDLVKVQDGLAKATWITPAPP
jgi:vitamin K-dependent gamma-carboxylase